MPARGQRFTKKHRLVKPTDFSEVFKSTKRVADANFVILYRPNGQDIARLGTAISKSNTRLATIRNKLKRLIRESFRCCKDSLGGLDIVVVAKRNINTKNHSMIAASLSKQWQKLNRA